MINYTTTAFKATEKIGDSIFNNKAYVDYNTKSNLLLLLNYFDSSL